MNFLYLKALHLIFAVTWFAGLFYIVRLFIYDVEANARPDSERAILQQQFRIMQRRLWYGITWPSAILILIFGTWLVISENALAQPWFHIKLLLLLGLYGYHGYCHYIFIGIQNGKRTYTSGFLRMWNEVATLFLIAIVFLAVLRSGLSMVYGIVGLIIIAIALMLAIRMYKKLRKQ